jgi:chemotaxis protein CheX
MNIEDLIPLCVQSTQQTLSMMAATESTPGDVEPAPDRKTWGDVTGIIGLAGANCKGNFCLSFSRSSIIKIVSNMLMEEFNDLDEDVIDAVGELTNMISGSVKAALLDGGADVQMASPVVIVGKDVPMTQFTGNPTMRIEFTTESGNFVVEITFKKIGE